MKRVIIYTTDDKVVSLHLVNKIVSDKFFKDYKFDIILSKPGLIRKLKILIVIIFFGSFKIFYKKLFNTISINQILDKTPNCKIISSIDTKTNYDYGLSVYCSSKIVLQKFKIYNFHLGSLKNQRGSFIFFYKFLKNWKDITLSFHEISDRFDVGKVLNERQINLDENCKATDILFVYLKNQDFLIESIKKINGENGKMYESFEKLNLVPDFSNIFKNIAKIILKIDN